jgi:hypothetical protein
VFFNIKIKRNFLISIAAIFPIHFFYLRTLKVPQAMTRPSSKRAAECESPADI